MTEPEEMSNVGHFIQSNRGKNLIVFNGYIYRRKKIYKETTYWNCLKDASGCLSKLQVVINTDPPIITCVKNKHNHDIPSETEVERKFERRIECLDEGSVGTHLSHQDQEMSTSRISDIPISSILPDERVTALVRSWLEEDTPNFDYGGLVVGNELETAQLLMKSPGVIAGIPFFNAVFHELKCEVDWLANEGDHHRSNNRVTVALVHGMCKNILLGERVALNCISRASGVASIATKYMKLTNDAGWKGKIAGTRKTTPGFRLVEKYALIVAGADTHRYNLSSMIMLKDNHIWSAGSIAKAVENVKSVAGFSMKVEVECQSLNEGIEAANAGADVVMFDNFSPETLHSSARALKSIHPKVIVDASGGIDESNLVSFCGPNIDVISTSKLIQGYPAVDFSLKIMKE